MKTKFYPIKRLWTWIFTGILLTLSPSLFAQFPVCTNPNTIFGIDVSGNIYPIDPATGVAGALINTASYTLVASYTTVVANQTLAPNIPNGIGYNNINGKFYYFKRDPGGANPQFVCYDPILNNYTNLAPLPGVNSVHAGCINFSGTGYYCLDVQSYLYYFNIATGTWTTITNNFTDQYGANVTATIISQNSGDMAVDGTNNMWLLPSNNTNFALYKLAAPLPTAPIASFVVWLVVPPTTATPAGAPLYGMAFDPMGKIFMSNNSGALYRLNNAFSAPVLVGTITSSIVPTDLTSCAFPLTVLPVKFNAFTATLKNKGEVLLSWNIAHQNENKGYDIERSIDGINWEVIGFDQNMQNNQTGIIQDTYFFTDLNPASKNNYYRIHAINYDGSGTYSPIRNINIKSTTNISLWPNPVTDIINIQIAGSTYGSGNAFAIVYDLSGKVLLKNVLQPGVNTVNLKSLPASTYLVQVQTPGGEMYNQKIIRQ